MGNMSVSNLCQLVRNGEVPAFFIGFVQVDSLVFVVNTEVATNLNAS